MASIASDDVAQRFMAHDIDGGDLITLTKMKIPELISTMDFMGISSMHTILKLIRRIKTD